jgi:hypothetical protein
VTPGELRQRLKDVYWVGGSPGAGKSTVARRLAARHRLELYVTDDVMHDHAGRSSAAAAPQLARFMAMDMDERWVNRSPRVMLDTFHWFRGEAFDLIVADLLARPAGTGVVAEGFRLLPHLVAPLLADRRRAVWLLPTPGFRTAALDRRGWAIPAGTSDPARARRNLIERDTMFTDRLAEETARLRLPFVRLDETGPDEDALTDRVAGMFGLG